MERNPFSPEGKTAGELLETIKSFEQNPFILSQFYTSTNSSYGKNYQLKRNYPSKEDEKVKRKSSSHERNDYEEKKLDDSKLDHYIAMTMKKSQKLPKNTSRQVTGKSIEGGHSKIDEDLLHYGNKTSKYLSKSKTGMLSELHTIESETEHHIQSALSLIPAQYFISHNMFDQIKTKSLESMMRILSKMRIKLLKQGINRWHTIATQMTATRRSRAAKLLNRMIRGFLGRLKAKRYYKQQLKLHNIEKKKMMKSMKTRNAQVIRIQSVIRCFIGRRSYLVAIRLHRSAIKIQRRFRSYYYHGRLLEAVYEMMARNKAAKVIQRVFRGFLGRMLSRIRRSEIYRANLQKQYETPKGLFALYFEQHGAAFTLQKWYRSLSWVTKLKGTERQAKARIIRDRKARQIQKIIRGNLARRRFLKLKEIRSLEKHYPSDKIILIQSVIRSYLVRCRHHELLFRFRQRQLRRKQQLTSISRKRRNAVSFPHLKIGNERNIMRMERKATVIQRWYKSCRILRYFIRMVSHRRILYICRIQCWYRTWVWREKREWAVSVIQPVWAKKIRNYLKRKRAAQLIQYKYRAYCSMKWFLNWKRNRLQKSNLIKRWLFYCKWKRDKRHDLSKRRNFLEFLESGDMLYRRSVTFAKIDEMWRRLQTIKTPLPKYEPQAVFIGYCPQGLLDMSKANKLFKECKGLVDNQSLTMKHIEMIFAKVKGASGRGLDYSQVIELYYYIACMKYYGIDASTIVSTSTSNRASTPPPPPATPNSRPDTTNRKNRAEMIQKQHEIIQSARFGRFRGKNAVISRFVYEYLTTNPFYLKSEEKLEKSSSQSVALSRINKALATIQKNFRYAIFIAGLARVRKAARKRKRDILRTKCAIKIQIIIRRYLARRKAVRLAQIVYSKYLDPDTQAIFWSNSRLGTSHWFKPKLLRELDCGDAIKMPTPDEQYTPLCSDCQTQYASIFCDECDRLFCDSCSSSFHKSGQRKSHSLIRMEMCIECGFQVPTKQCISCDENYCDTCFHFAHRRGRSRLHTYRWVTQRCDICEIRAAHYRHIDTWNLYAEELYCTICIKENWGENATFTVIDPTGQYETYPIQYYGPTVMNYRKKKYEDEIKKKKAEEYERLAAENMRRRREKNATNIQRVWRGRKVRREILHWIERRKYFLAQRKLEMPQRERKLYKFLQFIGFTPSLQYDTNKEKCLRRFPRYLHATVTDCLERKWGKFTDLLIPADLGSSAPDDTSKFQAVTTLLGLMKAKFSLFLAEKYLQRCEKKHQLARDKYRVARSSATMKADRKKILQSLAHDCLKAVERAKTKRDEEIDSVTYARKKWEHFAGPRALPNLINQRRSEGIPLPFTVDMASGSRYALVKYDVSTPNATMDSYFHRSSPPGTWKRRLKRGDILLIQGMHFKVVVGEDMLDYIEEFEGENDQSDDEYELDSPKKTDDNIDRVKTPQQTSVKKLLSRSQSAVNEPNSQPHDDQLPESTETSVDNMISSVDRTLKKGYTMLPLRSASRGITHRMGEVGLDHIKLDRSWLFEDVEYLSVYRIAKKPFYSDPFFQLERILHASWIIQNFIGFSAILLDKLSATISSMSKAFDEESETGAWFVDQGVSIGETRDWLLRASRKTINFDSKFKITDALLSALSYVYSIPKGLVLDVIANFKRYQALSRLSPYQRWELSDAKEDVIVNLEYGMDESDRLGMIHMDLDAPCNIAREYIQRKFRIQLNDHCGSSFSFYVRKDRGEEVMLSNDQEELKWVRDFTVMKVDDESGNEYPTLTIVVNAGEEKVFIEEVFDEYDPEVEEELERKNDKNDDENNDGFNEF